MRRFAVATFYMICNALPSCGGFTGLASNAAVSDVLGRASQNGGTVPVVNWQHSIRKDLEDDIEHGGIVGVIVSEDGEIQGVVAGCFGQAQYAYRGFTESKRTITSGLHSKDTVGAMSLTGTSVDSGEETGGGAKLQLHVVGRFIGPNVADVSPAPTGDCAHVTHFVSAAEYGAFTLTTGDRDKSDDGVGVGVLSANSSSESNSDATESDGNAKACRAANKRDTQPPDGCDVVLTIKLEALHVRQQEETAQAEAEEEARPADPAQADEEAPPAGEAGDTSADE